MKSCPPASFSEENSVWKYIIIIIVGLRLVRIKAMVLGIGDYAADLASRPDIMKLYTPAFR